MNLRSLTFVFNLTLKEEEYHKELLEPIESDYQSMTSQVRKRKTSPQVKGKQLTLQKVKGRKFRKVMCWIVMNDYFFNFSVQEISKSSNSFLLFITITLFLRFVAKFDRSWSGNLEKFQFGGRRLLFCLFTRQSISGGTFGVLLCVFRLDKVFEPITCQNVAVIYSVLIRMCTVSSGSTLHIITL